MSDPAIRVEGLGKRYRIGASQAPYRTLRETLVGLASAPAKRIRRSLTRGATTRLDNTIWALKDVSFEVNQGEALGIIGRNGAGKSSLLRILSRITRPTQGAVDLCGRVGSLLEVGTGFHPELTGRENIYLNGAIIGMRRSEIERKFNEIVAFAETGRFLDTAVKYYSSGMYIRLAFSVAAHMEPDILLVDEVLAVGDSAFQRKCLGMMGEVAQGGRTVLFVSHNMASIQALCPRVIVLDDGRIVSDAEASISIRRYLNQQAVSSRGDIDLRDRGKALRTNSLDDSVFQWTSARIINSQNNLTSSIKLGEPFEFVLSGRVIGPIDDLRVGFGVRSPMGVALFNSHSIDHGLGGQFREGDIDFRIRFDQNLLAPGTYIVDLGANGTRTIDWIPDAFQLTIEEASGDGLTLGRSDHGGMVIYPCLWSVATRHGG